MKKILLIGFVFSLSLVSPDCSAVDYYTISTGNLGGNIWSLTPGGPAIPGGLPALNDDDVLYINHNINSSPGLNTAARIYLVIDATLTMNASFQLGAGSVFIFPSASGRIVNGGPGNSVKIFIGPSTDGDEWSGNNGTITGPGNFGDGWVCCTLPIKLLSFETTATDNVVILDWSTSMEENFSKFIIQRSSDGLTFQDLGEVPGKGFNIYDIVSKYSFKDEAPLIGFNYYRLKAIDFDERYDYFGLKAVRITASKHISVFPNPSAGKHISFKTNFNPSESDRIVLMNQLGVEVFNGPATDLQHGISLPHQRPGIYLLRYVSKDFQQTARVIIND